MSKKKTTTKLITSFEVELVGSRFLVKQSIMDNGVDPMSIMMIVVDNLERGFTIKFFSNKDDATDLLRLLKAAS